MARQSSFLALLLWIVLCSARYTFDGYEYPNDRATTRDIDIFMPNVRPTEDDQYICSSKAVQGDLYILNFLPKATMKRAHHMLLYGCEDVPENYLNRNYQRDCSRVCNGQNTILFAWARNAASPTIPDDVGFHIGREVNINYLTLQIHYGFLSAFEDGETDTSGVTLRVTEEEQRYLGGIYLLLSMDIFIPPHAKNVHVDVACRYDNPTAIHAFAFRTHSHTLGKVITGYRIRNNVWTRIGRGDPQWPQAFYPMDRIYKVQDGDVLAARCTYDAPFLTEAVRTGPTHTDEMCNLYIMYYTQNPGGPSYQVCSESGDSRLFNNILPGSDDRPLQMPTAAESEENYNYYNMLTGMSDNHAYHNDNIPEIEQDLKNNVKDKIDKIEQKEYRVTPVKSTEKTSVSIDDRVPITPTSLENGDKTETDVEDASGSRVLNVVPLWGSDLSVGAVSGVDTDAQDNLYLFHRARRTWDMDSFDLKYNYLKKSEGPIPTDTIFILEKDTGKVMRKWGSNLFYIPHGLFVDHESNVWVTDVALHQVFKFSLSENPSLTLGEAFRHGSDDHHFCQPTDVVVHPETGDIFVSDGYCNSRIMKFSKNGKLINTIDNSAIGHLTPNYMLVVHSITLANNNSQVCVSDREHGRVLCFNENDGSFVRQYKLSEFGGRVFSTYYSAARDGILFIINGPSTTNPHIQGFTVNFTDGSLLETWAPNGGFHMPHDLTASLDGNEVYVSEIGPNRVWKFVDPVPSKELPQKSLPNPLARDSLLSHDNGIEKVPEEYGTTAIIVIVLAVPIVLMMAIAIVVRLHAQGKLNSGRSMFVIGKNRNYSNPDSFSIGNFFNKRKGFSQVNTDDSDQEGTTWSEESDVEEYSIMNSKRTQNL